MFAFYDYYYTLINKVEIIMNIIIILMKINILKIVINKIIHQYKINMILIRCLN